MKQGEILRDGGIQLSLFNAEIKIPDWKDRAIQALKNFINENPHMHPAFQTEDVRAWAYKNGLPEPPNHRAWGAVITSAKRKGLIRFIGYANVDNPKAHCTPASVWKTAKGAA
jgi:hypothetical protein